MITDDGHRACRRPSRRSTGSARCGAATSASPRRCCYALAFVSMFVIGGLSGIFMASTPVDIFIHDTYFIVAPHPLRGLRRQHLRRSSPAIYYWFPKMFGRMMNETLGKIHFWLTFISFNVHVLPDAHPRRRRPHAPHLQPDAVRVPAAAAADWNVFITVGAHLPRRCRRSSSSSTSSGACSPGRRREQNPWHANTLEWEAPTPPPHGNFPGRSRPCTAARTSTASPGETEDYLPQARRLEPRGGRALSWRTDAIACDPLAEVDPRPPCTGRAPARASALARLRRR